MSIRRRILVRLNSGYPVAFPDFFRKAGDAAGAIIREALNAFFGPQSGRRTDGTVQPANAGPEAVLAVFGPYYAASCSGLGKGREELFLHLLTVCLACSRLDLRTRSTDEGDEGLSLLRDCLDIPTLRLRPDENLLPALRPRN